jgi:hypothetical protein
MIVQIKAQTKDELLAVKRQKADTVAKLKSEMDSIQNRIDSLPGWRFKAFGTVGGSISGHKNWFSKKTPNSSVGDFGINIYAFAIYTKHKYFWKNKLNVNISWYKYNDRDSNNDSGDFSMGTDIFTVSSLFGRRFGKKYAVSAMGEYRSSVILDKDSDPVSDFNNPGYLDIGIGGTWTPLLHLHVVVLPLNYNFIFHDSKKIYESSPGSKFVIDYTREFGNLNIFSNLSFFISYKSFDYSSYLWTNTISYTFWKKFGVALDFGLRKNKQEAFNYLLEDDPNLVLADADNKLQSYWLFGLHIKLD